MVGRQHPLDRHEFEQALGDSEGIPLITAWNSVHHLLGFYSSVSLWEFQLYEGRHSCFAPFILSGIWEVLKMSD